MGLARFVVDAVLVEGRRPTEIARTHGISRSWVYALLVRYRAGGYAALEPRSRRPHTSPGRTAPELEAAIIALRASLGAAGHDCGRRRSPRTSRGRTPLPRPRRRSGASSAAMT